MLHTIVDDGKQGQIENFGNHYFNQKYYDQKQLDVYRKNSKMLNANYVHSQISQNKSSADYNTLDSVDQRRSTQNATPVKNRLSSVKLLPASSQKQLSKLNVNLSSNQNLANITPTLSPLKATSVTRVNEDTTNVSDNKSGAPSVNVSRRTRFKISKAKIRSTPLDLSNKKGSPIIIQNQSKMTSYVFKRDSESGKPTFYEYFHTELLLKSSGIIL